MSSYWGPPESDSDDDYEGFTFGDDEDPEIRRQRRAIFVVDVEDELYQAIIKGDLNKLNNELITMTNFKIDEPIKTGLTLLHYACRFAHLHIVKYLLNEKNANANRQVDSITPIMEACCCEMNLQKNGVEIVKLLIDNKAIINISDKYGMTPFMYACKNGLYEIVKFLLLTQRMSYDAIDNQGYTSLFHAVESNHVNIVKLLIDSNKMNLGFVNKLGYTAKQMAQFNDYEDIVNCFPPEEYKYLIPPSYFSYNSISDLIPQIFIKKNQTNVEKIIDEQINNDVMTLSPEYFPDIHEILLNIQMENFLDRFALAKMNLYQFLSVNEEKLKEIGIEYSIHRKKILLGILNYHLYNWSKKSIARVKGREKENFYDILLIIGNHLKNVIIINSSITFVEGNLKNNYFGKISKECVKSLKNVINSYRTEVNELQNTCKYLHSFTPEKPPLLINYETFLKHKKRRKINGKIKNYCKYSIIISLSVVICLKIKKFL